ncbi:MAG: YlxR family protein [Clostridia bacterium]|nr:YlxR family protein [Clostridia bacterium]
MKSVHKPVRECICCGNKFPKNSLFRIVKNDSGIFFDESGKADGRGAYICKSAACHEKLVKQKRLNRAFKGPVEESVYRSLIEQLESTRSAEQETV